MQSNGLDIFAADSYASRYSKPRRGRKPRADAPVMGTPAEIASILSKMRAISRVPLGPGTCRRGAFTPPPMVGGATGERGRSWPAGGW